MLQIVLFLLLAIGAAAAALVWAWHDHVVTHPWAVRPSGTVGRAVDRWELLMIRIARAVPVLRHPAD